MHTHTSAEKEHCGSAASGGAAAVHSELNSDHSTAWENSGVGYSLYSCEGAQQREPYGLAAANTGDGGDVTVEVKEAHEPAEDGGSVGLIARGRRSLLRQRSFVPSTAGPQRVTAVDRDAVPLVVEARRSVDEQGYSLEQLWRVRYSLIAPIYIAFKTAALVTLPLCILCFSDATKSHFKAGSLMAVVGTSNTKLYLGQQISGSIIIMQGAVWMILWGTFVSAVGATRHESAWWGLAFAVVVLVSFFTNFRSRRVMMSYSIIVMQLMRSQGDQSVSTAANAGADLLLAVCFAMAQAFVPYPLLMSRYTDEKFKAAWKQVGTICTDVRAGVWSGRAFSGNVAAAEVACDDLTAVAKGIPGLLFFISYEPFERSLYNQLRNERLTLLQRMLVILNATCTGARLFTSMSSSETREAQLQWKEILRVPVDEYLHALRSTLAELGESLEPATTVRRCPFELLQSKKDALLRALQSCRAHVARGDPAAVDAPAFYAFLYFHLLLALQADELHTFAEQLAAFDPRRYTSTWRRFLEFFFLDFWDDFRNKLLGRVLLRTRDDRRTFKEGLKLACAYTVAAAFTTKLNSEDTTDTYFFGMSIILGMGLPTVSESIEVGVHRIAGMSFALVIGYIARWKTFNFVQEIAVVVCGSFMALCLRDSTRYMHVAWYASFIAPSAYGIARDRITMIARVVDCSFAVAAYFVVCTMMFPINPYRVLWNLRSLSQMRMADTVTTLSSVVLLPMSAEVQDIVIARLAIAAEHIRFINGVLGQSQEWVNICAKEPALIGNPFPTEQAQRVQLLLQHMCAGLEIWLFGLQLLHRPRTTPTHPLIGKLMDAVRPLLTDLEVASRVVFQDLIDAVNVPLEWNVEQSVRRFSDFVLIKGKLDAAFHELHRDMNIAQMEHTRRAIAHLGEHSAQEGMVNKSFIGQRTENYCIVHDYADNYSAGHTINPHLYHSVDSMQAEVRERERERDTAPQQQQQQQQRASPTQTSSQPPAGTPLTRTFNLSFRAPAGNLPIDVDVTAFTIIIASVAALTASLEHTVPFTTAINKFLRSRYDANAFTVREFFLCKK
ncbi:hypothetical protein NESM_000362600 [Novymonas esmeraldas]|uniref:Uncharacterized protein n=1 Tax=Novymonas esmeraldas TaxID=1808958 RepID=A0AAW0EMN2_9TRYP